MTLQTNPPKKAGVEPIEENGESDEALLERYRDTNDVDAFESLVHRYELPIYRYLYGYLHDAQLAEDVFQATILRVHSKCHLYTPGRPVRPWLYRIANRCAIDRLRKEKRHRAVRIDESSDDSDSAVGKLVALLESDQPSPFARLNRKERGAWARRAVAELPERLRAVILLIYFEGLKYREVAETLEIPVGTVKSRAHQAILKLNEAWRLSHKEMEE